jgi:hypothetical protein
LPTARIVQAEGCGKVFRDRDVDDVVRSLTALCDPSVRCDLGHRGHEAVLRRFHWAFDTQQLLAAVEGAARRDRPALGPAEP